MFVVEFRVKTASCRPLSGGRCAPARVPRTRPPRRFALWPAVTCGSLIRGASRRSRTVRAEINRARRVSSFRGGGGWRSGPSRAGGSQTVRTGPPLLNAKTNKSRGARVVFKGWLGWPAVNPRDRRKKKNETEYKCIVIINAH